MGMRYPTAPTAGLDHDRRAALADRLNPEELPALLAAHRAGCDDAERRLLAGLRWSIYACIPNDRWEPGSYYLGLLWLGLADSVAQLRENSVADAWTHARKEVRRCLKDFYREISQNLLPPASTKSARRKRGMTTNCPKRQDTVLHRGRWVDALIDLETLTRAGYIQPAPGSDLEDHNVALIEQLFADSNAVEISVFRLAMSGCTQRETAERLGITRWRVRKILQAAKLRLK